MEKHIRYIYCRKGRTYALPRFMWRWFPAESRVKLLTNGWTGLSRYGRHRP